MTEYTAYGNFMYVIYQLHIYNGYTHLEYYIDVLYHLHIVDKYHD